MKVIKKAKSKKLSNSHKKTKSKQLGGGSKHKNTRVARLRLSQRGGASAPPRRNNKEKLVEENGSVESDEEYVERQLEGKSKVEVLRVDLLIYNLNIILTNPATPQLQIAESKTIGSMLGGLFDERLITAMTEIGYVKVLKIAETILSSKGRNIERDISWPILKNLQSRLAENEALPPPPPILSPKRTVTGASASGAFASASTGTRGHSKRLNARRGSHTTKGLHAYLESLGAAPVSNSSDEESTSPTKSFTHYWYNTWPDLGVPIDINHFQDFIEMLKGQIEGDRTGGKTIIHCSAGVGRTGTVFVCLYLLVAVTGGIWHVKNEQVIIDAIKYARRFRMLQVQTKDQYKFICNCFGIEVPIKTPLYNQIPKQLFPLVIYSITKDRYKNILPYVNNHITLTNGTYINASPANIGQYQFILTQCPIRDTIRDTIPDFHDMILEQNVSRIVMLTGLVEKGHPKCDDYLDLGSGSDLDIPFILNDYKFTKLRTRQFDGYQERNYQMTLLDSSRA